MPLYMAALAPVTPVAPVAPVAPVTPVAPVAPVAPYWSSTKCGLSLSRQSETRFANGTILTVNGSAALDREGTLGTTPIKKGDELTIVGAYAMDVDPRNCRAFSGYIVTTPNNIECKVPLTLIDDRVITYPGQSVYRTNLGNRPRPWSRTRRYQRRRRNATRRRTSNRRASNRRASNRRTSNRRASNRRASNRR